MRGDGNYDAGHESQAQEEMGKNMHVLAGPSVADEETGGSRFVLRHLIFPYPLLPLKRSPTHRISLCEGWEPGLRVPPPRVH